MSEEQAVVPSRWAKSMDISETVVQEVKLFNNMGWALDGYGKPKKLSEDENKMMALICHKLGLSPVGKQVFFLGNSVYVAKTGKISKARRDANMPLVRIDVRPATEEEREAAGLIYNDPEEAKKFEHYWHATIFAKLDGEVIQVANEFGHACVSNINLRGKENDPRRLCSDMAKTRAISRGLSMVYDFFGVDSYEEVALGQPKANEVIDVEAEVVEQTEGGCSIQDVLVFMEENREHLPPAQFEKYTEERLKTYHPDALKETLTMLESHVKQTKESEQQPELGLPETNEPEKESKAKVKPKTTK